MFSTIDQENLTAAHHTTAANKPLNQGIRAYQAKTPGPHRTPFRARNDENAPLNTVKAAKNVFVTPAPRIAARAPLGAKTTNAKAQAFQTPAPGLKPAPSKLEQTLKRPSTTRRSVKKQVFVDPQPAADSADAQLDEDTDNEPDFGYAPPEAQPLPDSPIDFSEIDQTYSVLKPENINRGIEQIYFQSPKDENGFSISQKKQEEEDKNSLQQDLESILQVPVIKNSDPDDQVKAMIAAGPRSSKSHSRTKSQAQQSQVDTIRARSAASALSRPTTVRKHQRLPSTATKDTASTKSKRKPTFAVATDIAPPRSVPGPISRTTIGFPKAKKPASILPTATQKQPLTDRTGMSSKVQRPSEHELAQSQISPRKFVELYGEPPVESEMWFRLMALEIKDRHRDDVDRQEEDNIFQLDMDQDLDDKLRMRSHVEEDFELNLDDF